MLVHVLTQASAPGWAASSLQQIVVRINKVMWLFSVASVSHDWLRATQVTKERHADALNAWERYFHDHNPIRRQRPIHGDAAASTLPRSLGLQRARASSQLFLWVHAEGSECARWHVLMPWEPLGWLFNSYFRGMVFPFEPGELAIAHMRLYTPQGEGRRLDRRRSPEELRLADSAHVEVYLDGEIPTDGWYDRAPTMDEPQGAATPADESYSSDEGATVGDLVALGGSLIPEQSEWVP